jgi:hypothetical protein
VDSPPTAADVAEKRRDEGLTLTPGQGSTIGGMNALTRHATRAAVAANGLRKAYGRNVVLDGVELSIGRPVPDPAIAPLVATSAGPPRRRPLRVCTDVKGG